MAHRKEKLRGEECFNNFYSNTFGNRWNALHKALLDTPAYIEWHSGGTSSYFLDAGSALAALCFPIDGAKSLLDMCAAPGGKSLILASRMDSGAHLVCNDRSAQRSKRLLHVLDNCLDKKTRERVFVSRHDGGKWCTQCKDRFERIFLDAPCSSERHVLSNKELLNAWSPSRIRSVTTEQWALLSSAFRMLSPAGYMMYATCALCYEENDAMIKRLLNKFDTANVIDVNIEDVIKNTKKFSIELPGATKTETGYHILPDRQHGAGPLFFSLIYKHP